MPIVSTIDQKNQITIHTASGNLTYDELVQTLEAFYRNEHAPESVLWDGRNASLINLTHDQLKKLAVYTKKFHEQGLTVDLTINNAEQIRDFYCRVIEWDAEPVDMGGYNDFNMKSSDGTVRAGICHSRGVNANIPPQWLLYASVRNLDHSVQECHSNGGKVVDGPRMMGKSRFCVIQDPAGAVLALIETPD
ncbi:MAG: VOC family protein [Bacteroidota bacterium]